MARRQVVTVEGMERLAKKLETLPEDVREGVRKAVKDETREVADDMRRTVPRLTGELARSIQVEITNNGVSGAAVATARHATFVEHGTEDTPERPFAAPAAERSRKRFPKRLREETGRSLWRLTR